MGAAALVAALTVLAAPNGARADVVQLDGTPLDVFVDGIGGLQVRVDQSDVDASGEFCCSSSDPGGNGFALRAPQGVSMPSDGLRAPVEAPVLTGPVNGTRTVSSSYDVTIPGDGSTTPDFKLHIAETVAFTDGTRDVRLHFDITNLGGAPASFSAGELADLYAGGSDEGQGLLAPGPPRFVGGTTSSGGADGLVEVPGSGWTNYEEAFYGDVFGDFRAGPLKNTIVTDPLDNGVGVEWAVTLDARATRSIDATWRFGASTDATAPPAPQIADPGSMVTGSAVTLSGTAEPGSSVTIFDAGTPVGGTVADGNGNWTVTLTGVAPGTHRYTAVARDGAGNVSSASAERDVVVATTPAATPTPTAAVLPPPVVGKLVNAKTKSGTVKIKVPGSNRFITLGPGAQVPVGTTIDATKGRITLTTAVGGGKTQQADFYQGVFKISQTKGKHPLTTLTLVGPKPMCSTAKQAHASAKKKVKTRRLWGSGKGAFQTRGQYSSATVRGTTWLTQDSCAGTLVKVTRGAVTVRDFVKRKNVLVRAGKHYLARAKRH